MLPGHRTRTWVSGVSHNGRQVRWANTTWDTRVVNQPLLDSTGVKQTQIEKCGDPTTVVQKNAETNTIGQRMVKQT